MTKSAQIREMFKENEDITISEIAEELDIRYQYVYQVLRKYCAENDVEMPVNNNGETKADKIRELWDDGMTIGDIAKELETNYTYCWSVVDKYRKDDNGEDDADTTGNEEDHEDDDVEEDK